MSKIMEPLYSAPASLQKTKGTISIAKDRSSIIWTASGQASKTDIPIDQVGGFQQSPASSVKALIKISSKIGDQTYKFQFLSSTRAKEDKESFVSLLTDIIQKKNKPVQLPILPAAKESTATKELKSGVLPDSDYLTNINLQKSLIIANKDDPLTYKFKTALKQMKLSEPKVSNRQFSSQFFASRVHLLRSFAAERAQSLGHHNILTEIKLTYGDNEGGQAKISQEEIQANIYQEKVQANISHEQIQAMFRQHPIIETAYKEMVPNPIEKSQQLFWRKFITSKLFRQLKGEKFTDYDNTDFDRYLDKYNAAPRPQVPHISKFLDLDGNEQDHTETLGNMPDIEMRPENNRKAPILRALNTISGSLMADVSLKDSERLYDPAGMDEAKYEQIRLHDLNTQDKDNRVLLNVDPSRKFLSKDTSKNSSRISNLSYLEVMSIFRAKLALYQKPMKTHLMNTTNTQSKLQSKRVTKRIITLAKKRTTLQNKSSHALNTTATDISAMNLSRPIKESITTTYTATSEFLSYFWAAFLSGSTQDARIAELTSLGKILLPSLHESIGALADEAEAAKSAQLQALRNRRREQELKTGKKRKIDRRLVPEGKARVAGLLKSIDRQVSWAMEAYGRAKRTQRDNSGNIAVAKRVRQIKKTR